jgi:diacylglycerol kinase
MQPDADPAGAGHEPRGARRGGRLASFRYAGRGLRALVASQPNARIHALVTLAAAALAAALVGLLLFAPRLWAAWLER